MALSGLPWRLPACMTSSHASDGHHSEPPVVWFTNFGEETSHATHAVGSQGLNANRSGPITAI